jgi:hypothetical protein
VFIVLFRVLSRCALKKLAVAVDIREKHGPPEQGCKAFLLPVFSPLQARWYSWSSHTAKKLKNMQNPLSRLALDAWYKVIIVVGTFIILLNGAGLLPKYPIKETLMIGLGCIIWGIAEWINHPMHETVHPKQYGFPSHVTIDRCWRPSIPGLILDAVGLGLIIFSFVKLF